MPSGHAHGLLRSGKLHRMPGACPAYWKLQPADRTNVGNDSQCRDSGGNTMNRRSVISMGLVLAGSAVFWHAHDAIGQTGWTTLFDGANLNNFEPIGNANWRLLEGGVVQADVGSGFLVTKQ